MTPIIGALDTETTGLLTSDHRIIEVHIQLLKDRKSIWRYEQRIDPQRSIAADAQKVHKISATDLIGKPVWETVGPVLHKVLSKCTHFMAHNAEFDHGFLVQEFKRIGLVMPECIIIDTMAEGLWATPDGKKPRLQELCFALGIEYDPALAHAAAYDVDKMIECYFAGIDMGFYADVFKQETLLAA